jgi:hypothetical protein
MQNPFARLTKYRQEDQENRTTECLAACLVFSEAMRREFLRFLFGENLSAPFDAVDAASFSVSTQEQTANGLWVDLLIEKEGEWSIVIEVKVKAPEKGEQIKAYWEWLNQTRQGSYHVFSLVKKHDPNFDIKAHNGTKHYTWRQLYDQLSKGKEIPTTDATVMGYFCEYLELEGIVNTWHPSQILDFGRGVVASKAVVSLFRQVVTRLEETNEGFAPKIVISDPSGPRLDVGMKSWDAIFGKNSQQKALRVIYNDEQIRPDHEFGIRSEIFLWDKSSGGDWTLTQPKINQWLRKMTKLGFTFYAFNRGWKGVEKDLCEYQFADVPLLIGGYANTEKWLIRPKEIESASADDLAEMVYLGVLWHSKMISQLAKAP